jgi:hypothetical protein
VQIYIWLVVPIRNKYLNNLSKNNCSLLIIVRSFILTYLVRFVGLLFPSDMLEVFACFFQQQKIAVIIFLN